MDKKAIEIMKLRENINKKIISDSAIIKSISYTISPEFDGSDFIFKSSKGYIRVKPRGEYFKNDDFVYELSKHGFKYIYLFRCHDFYLTVDQICNLCDIHNIKRSHKYRFSYRYDFRYGFKTIYSHDGNNHYLYVDSNHSNELWNVFKTAFKTNPHSMSVVTLNHFIYLSRYETAPIEMINYYKNMSLINRYVLGIFDKSKCVTRYKCISLLIKHSKKNFITIDFGPDKISFIDIAGKSFNVDCKSIDVTDAIKYNGNILKYILKNDQTLEDVKICIKNNPESFKYASGKIKKSFISIQELIKINSRVILYVSQDIVSSNNEFRLLYIHETLKITRMPKPYSLSLIDIVFEW